jgi:hypothetical protein
MTWSFNYIAITNCPVRAKLLSDCGVQQLMVDTEILGKVERQGHKDTVISNHKLSDVRLLKNLNLKADIICRINPFNENTQNEIDTAIVNGADTIMIPMINSIEEYRTMVDIIGSRAHVLPLIETPYSFFKATEIIGYSQSKQIHFGLNDLSISMGMRNLFEVLLTETFQNMVTNMSSTDICIGIGGIGDPQVSQKVSPLLLLNAYLKCGSNSVILSRNFFASNIDKGYIIKSLQRFEEIILTGYKQYYNAELLTQVNEM